MKTTARYQEWLTGVKHLMVDVNTKQKQVDIAGKIKITPVYLNAVLRGRRIAAPLTQDKISEALGADYDAIREKGRAAMGLPPLGVTVSTTQNGGVNNVTMQGIFQTAEPDPIRGDITRDLCAAIARRMEGLDIDAQIALRARVKAALDEQRPTHENE